MTHGGNIFEIERQLDISKDKLLDFSANINPLGVPKTLINIIKNRVEDLQYYPDIDYQELKFAISQYYSIEKKHIFIGNGAVQVIFDIIHALQPQKAIILAPTFSEYKRALASVKSNVIEYYLREEDDFILNTKGLIELIDDSIDLVILCNPNNPTSKLIDVEKLKEILEKCKKHKAYLMIDEAFMDFIQEDELYSMVRYYKNEDFLVIVRAFTKFYGIPGLRLGFGFTTNENLLEKIQNRMIPWTLNTFAGYFGEVLKREEEYVKKTYQWLNNEKKKFTEALQNIEGIKVFLPSANFLLLKIEKHNINVFQIKEKLLRENILIRDCSNFSGLDGKFFRIAIKSSQDNKIFANKLKKIMAEY